MKKTEISDIIGNIDARHIEESADYRPKHKVNIWLKLTPAAACLVLVLSICLLPLFDFSKPSDYKSILALTVYADDGTPQGMELDQTYLKSSVSGIDAFGKDVPIFEFYVAPVENGEKGDIFEKYDIEISYGGKVVEDKDEHIRLLLVKPQHEIYGIGRYGVIGWFEETTDILVTLKDKKNGGIIEKMTVNVSYSEADAAYKLIMTDFYSTTDAE